MNVRVVAFVGTIMWVVPAWSYDYTCLRMSYTGTECHGNNWIPGFVSTPCLAGDVVRFKSFNPGCGVIWEFPDGSAGDSYAFPLAGDYGVRAIPLPPAPPGFYRIQIVNGYAISYVSAFERAAAATITIIRGAPPDTTSTIEYATSDDTAKAGIHYVATAGILTFAPGELSKTVTVPLIQDDDFQYASFDFSITNPSIGQVIGRTKQSVLIVDDEPPPVVGFTEHAYVGAEGGSLDVTLTRTGSAGLAFTVYLKMPSVFGLANTHANFAAGEMTKSVHFDVAQNDCFGPGRFTMELWLPLQPNGVLLSTTHRSASVSLTEDEPVPTLTMSDINIVEGSSHEGTLAPFTIASSGRICDSEDLLIETLGGTATSGRDYRPVRDTGFHMSDETVSYVISIWPDYLMEPDETFTLEVGLPEWPSTLTRARCTILNDDGPPAVVTIDPPDAASVTSGSDIRFSVIFGVPVRGIDPTDFAVIEDGVNGSRILVVTPAGNDSRYAVTMRAGDATRTDGTVALGVVDDDTIVDELGNPLGGVGAGNGNAVSAPVAVQLGQTVPLLDPVALAMLAALLTVVALASLRA